MAKAMKGKAKKRRMVRLRAGGSETAQVYD